MQQNSPIASQASVLANAVATALCKNLTLEEQNVFGNLFALIGASMLSVAAINQAVSSASQNINEVHKDETTQDNEKNQAANTSEG